ncbi:hypothetical protein IFM89_018267 [Coptis chinensis]|uniref:ABC transporter C family member 3 n=1 Tax=Coptis chinensis TaxID=261450 RepID=A0A835LB93_9MAGN|nr:hypothetical protein IFM89_018267 [Coptis chinensis]
MVSKKNKEDNVLHEPLLNDRTSRSSSSSSSSNSSIRSCSREHTKGDNSTPLSNANFFSALTFSWIGPLLAVGNEKQLNLEDVPPLGGADSANGIYPIVKSKLDSYSSDDGEVSSLKLAKALIFSIWREILWTAILTFVFTCCSYVGPYLIDTFVQYVNGRRNYKYEGYVLVSVFIVSKFVECFCERHTSFKSQQIGLRVRAALAAMIYRKAQTLSIPSRQVHTSGEVINFMVVDAVRVSGCSWVMHNWWTVPLQIVLALLILYRNLGLASIAAFFATVLTMLVNFPVGKCEEYLQNKLMEAKDGRVTTTSEVLRNMKILKLQGWEMKFLARIVALRENEEGWLRKFLFLAAASTVIFYAAPMFVSIVTFVTCVLIGIPLESGKILSALAIFSILRVAIYNLPQTISVLAEAKVVIEINNGNFTWDPPSHPPTLRNVNLQVFRGMRVGVCGTVGSGKSSLLSCILGEMPKVSGNIRLCGTKAYVAQSPWIQSGKVEENILFGKEMNRERYERVLDVCSLKKDLEILSFGDQTIVGERGINLSGGQKQRIQIARALYQDADIYLFDDPFSALDAHTGMHLYKACLLGFLSSKTVVYATNQVEFLPSADLILVLNDGIITHSGKYNEILTSTTGLMELVGAHKKALYGSTNFGTEKGGQDNEDVTNSDEENGNAEEDTEQKPQTSMDELLETEAQLVQEEEREKRKS